MIGDFHFLRPWWLAAIVPAALLVWAIYRSQDRLRPWRNVIAPHLLPFLLTTEQRKRHVGPLAAIFCGWILTAIALAGPTWRKEASPFSEDTAALAIVVKVSPSMRTEDVQPDRLTRAVHKVSDLLAQRGGAKTLLVAFAGSAHVVMPLTKDAGIINTFAEALDPKIMPSEGDATAEALRLADETLAKGGGGSIVLITDQIAGEQTAAVTAWRKKSSTPVRILAPLLDGPELDALKRQAGTAGARVVQVTPDDGDVQSLSRLAKYSATSQDTSDRWRESGYWLTPLIALLMLNHFRRGWMTRTAAHT